MTTSVSPRPSGHEAHPAPTREPSAQELTVPKGIKTLDARTLTFRSETPAPPMAGARAIALLRIATGFVFLWAFLDKLFGLGYSTTEARSWLSGGSPTKGFLSHVAVGPLQGTFGSIAGAWWADLLFMIGLGAIGIAVMLGIGTRIAAVSGTVIMLLMWIAEYPLARFTSAGDPSGSTNPLVDYHIIYALALIVVAATAAHSVWGLGKRWVELPFVQKHAWLK